MSGGPDPAASVAPSDLPVPPGDDADVPGFLAALVWGLGHERAAQVGCVLAAYVVETVGTQEYQLRRANFMNRFRKAYGDDAATEVQQHLQ